MTWPTKFNNKIGTRPATKITSGVAPVAPNIGGAIAPKPIQDGTHNYLGPHKSVFPKGFLSASPQLGTTARATQGLKGFSGPGMRKKGA